jgi:hypothetical protein
VVRIRVGRWTYDTTIAEDGTATFTTKLGGAKTPAQGEYAIA